MLIWKSFLLAFTALFPLINPIGSAIVFLGLVGGQPLSLYRHLARGVATATLIFMLVIQFLGSLLLSFFGVSLPVVQVAGGLVIAATAWNLLFEKDANADARDKHQEIAGSMTGGSADLNDKIFYPFTFPITAGPGTLVIMLTLSAHLSSDPLADKVQGHLGIALAAALLAIMIYFCYGYAPKLISRVSSSSVHGMLRVVAFILMCIGVQITWNGVSLLEASLLSQR